MILTLQRLAAVRAFLLPLLITVTTACASGKSEPTASGQRSSLTDIALVQSVPEETDLAHPDVAYAKDLWVKLIDESRDTIDIEQMYLDGAPGHATDAVIAALQRAGERGVKTRLIVAKQMLSTSKPTLDVLLKIRGLEHRVIDLGKITGGIQHAKFWIFDQKKIFVGSQNFDWKALTEILETGIVAEDAVLTGQLQSVFDLDWEMALTGRKPDDLGIAPLARVDADVRLVAAPASLNPRNIPSAFDELTTLLKSAKKSVRVTLLDYSTYLFGKPGQWLELETLLRETAARGVKIEFLMSHWNTEKPEVDSIKRLAQVPGIEVRLATIPVNSKNPSIPFARVNHSKFMTVDGRTLWVGTSNWSQGYFKETRGIEFVIQRPELAAQADVIFDKLWNASYTEAIDINKDYPKPRK